MKASEAKLKKMRSLRISNADYELMRAAARKLGISITELVVQAARERSAEVLNTANLLAK